jgi:signal transduction histidine kinase
LNLRHPILLLALAALVPAVSLSAALGAAWLKAQQGATEREVLAQADRTAALVAREIDAQTQVLRALSEMPALDRPPAEAAAAFAETAERVRRLSPLWVAVSLSDPDGNRIADAPAPIGGVAAGRVVDAESHARAVQGLGPVVGPVVRGPRGRAAFAIRTPALRQGKAVAVVSAVIGVEGLRDLLLSSGLPEGWLAMVVDSAGNVAARTTGPPETVGGPASETARAARARMPPGLHDGETLEGEPLKTAVRALAVPGWTVHVGIPRTAFRAPLVRAGAVLGAGGSVALLLAGSFLWLLARALRERRREQEARAAAARLEALGRLTGGVAHDFSNLVMIVQGAARAIQRHPGDLARAEEMARAIQAAAARGASLTRQLLAYARQDAHAPEDFDLRDRAAELLGMLRQATGEAVRTTLAIPEGTWPVRADPDAFAIALINLAVNARDAMPGGGTLAIEARNATLDGRDPRAPVRGDFVALAVRDTGAGIAKEHLDRVFEPFFTTKAVGKGTGLGLSQVYGFARQSGGAVTVASAPGEGAAFTLYLPRAAAPASAPAPAPAQGPAPGPRD